MNYRVINFALLFGLVFASLAAAKETKDIEFKFGSADSVIFSHEFHLKRYNNNCKVCHNAIFDLKNRRRHTMAEMEKTKSCGACHSGVKAFSVADEKYCKKCHKNPRLVTYKVKGATEAVFSHESHLKSVGGKCKSCHTPKVIGGKKRGVSMAQMEQGRTCGACHNGKTAFTVAGNCGNCHKGMKPKDITFKVKGLGSAVFSHDRHINKYTCKDCHSGIFPFKAGAKHYTMVDMEKGKSCGACHDGKKAFASSGDCTKCHTLKPGEITFKTEMGGARFSHQIHLKMFKCQDCHTKFFPYRAGEKHATMGDMEEGKSCGGCHNGKDAFTVRDDCIKCHLMK